MSNDELNDVFIVDDEVEESSISQETQTQVQDENSDDELSDVLSALDDMNHGGYLEDLKFPSVKEEAYDENNEPKQKFIDVETIQKEVLEKETNNRRIRDFANRRDRQIERTERQAIPGGEEEEKDIAKTLYMFRKELQMIKKRLIIVEETGKIINPITQKVNEISEQIAIAIEKSNSNEFAMQLSKEDINTIATIATKKVMAQFQNKPTPTKSKNDSFPIWKIIGVLTFLLFVGGLAFYKFSLSHKLDSSVQQSENLVTVKKNAKMRCDGIDQTIEIQPQQLKGHIADDTFTFYAFIENKNRKCTLDANFISK